MAEDHGQLEVGYHDARTCPNCRMKEAYNNLSDGDIFALEWFSRNVSSFTMESGMIGNLMNSLEFNGGSRELFLLKLNLIYQSIRDRELEELKNGR